MKLHVLIVDDRAAAGLRQDLLSIPRNKRENLANEDIVIETETSSSAAEELLCNTKASGRVFDIMILDLKLPKTTGGPDLAENGLKVLETAQTLRAVRETIAITSIEGYEFPFKAIRGGAIDFVQKSVDPVPLQSAVLASLDRILWRDSASILDQRTRDLVPHAERGLVYRFGMCFSRSIQELGRASDALKAELAARLGLDPEQDPDDQIARWLRHIDLSLDSGRREWGELQISVGIESGGAARQVRVDMVVSELLCDFEPCLITKCAVASADTFQQSTVLSFNGDVRAVLGEMILGGLAELPDYSEQGSELRLSTERQGDWTGVVLRDNLTPISAEIAGSINEGYGLKPDPGFGRAWGLSVMQHVALRGGGRLTIEPSDQGNTITYRIPPARHG